MDFTRLKKLVVPEGTVKKVEIGGKTVWQKKTEGPFTAAQSAAIRAGNFTGVPVGYAWTFSNVPYTYLNENNATVADTYSGTMRVADCDYYLNTGDTPLTTHHVVVVPDAKLYSAQMNSSNTTSGGYAGSTMRTVHLRRAEAIFKACFGERHLLKHREYLADSESNGQTTGSWYDSTVELMDELMVYSSSYFVDTGFFSISNKQLSLFKNDPSRISSGYWLRKDGVSNHAAVATSDGHANVSFVINSYGVRPAVLIY